MRPSSGKPRPPQTKSAIPSGLATTAATLVVSISAAVAGVILARKFGRDAATDGLLAAYGIYLVAALTAQAFRLVVGPDLTRAAIAGRLGAETRSYALALVAIGVPVSVLAIAFAQPLGEAVTGALPEEAAVVAGDAMVWLVPAAFAQLLAALAASALGAVDRYGAAALGHSAGGIAAVLVFLALADSRGPLALAYGIAVNSALCVLVPLAALGFHAKLLGSHRGGAARARPLIRLLQAAVIPMALQGLYLVALRLAADLGVGSVTSLSYAYLFAATLVAATASSVSIISTAPLTRRGIDAEAAAAHLKHAAWVSLVAIAPAAAIFALVGDGIVEFVLGEAFAGVAGREVGELVAYLAPWMVAAVAFSVAFPLVFVAGRSRPLIVFAVATVALHIPVSLGFREALELPGLALALGVSTLALVFALVASLSTRALGLASRAVGWVALAVTVLTLASFGSLALILGDASAAGLGLAAYTAALAALRPRGLREAWAYVRALR